MSHPETQPTWNSVLKPINFIPLQNSKTELKKLMPYRRKVNVEHVVRVFGTGLTEKHMADMIKEINEESLAVVTWGREQVKQRMMFAMARVGLKVGDRNAKLFTDIKDSWRLDTSESNIARIYEICYGDYEGEKAKRWSSNLEAKYMREMRLEYNSKSKNMREKGGIEMCITKAKVDMVNKVWSKKAGTSLVLSLKGETGLPAEMVAERKREKMMIEKNEGKAYRRDGAIFYLKIKVRKMINEGWSACHFRRLTNCSNRHACRKKEYGKCFTRV
jgi:hypothetical protein